MTRPPHAGAHQGSPAPAASLARSQPFPHAAAPSSHPTQVPQRRRATPDPGIRTIDLAGAAVCAALTVGAYFLLIAPTMKHRADLQNASLSLEQKRQEVVQADAELSHTQRALADLTSRLTSTMVKLDPPSDLNKRLGALTHLAAEVGLTIDRLEPGEPRNDDLHTAVPMTISGVGSFSACVDFLDHLRLNFRDTAAAGITLSRTAENDADSGPVKATYTFELEWYAAPAASAGAPTDK